MILSDKEWYRYTSPVDPKHIAYKVRKMREKIVQSFEGKVTELLDYGHPEIEEERRSLIVIETNNTKVRQYFKKVA